ncbi:MAG TPA: hypothetical protein VJ951_05760 [Bacteroidales bacterium]|nr:hypothetical protein [Bacteroidales bacterium]
MSRNNINDINSLPEITKLTGDYETDIKYLSNYIDNLTFFLNDTLENIIQNVAEKNLWNDVRVSATAVKTGGSAPGFGSFGSSGNLKTYLFSSSSDEEVHFNIQMPHGVKLGTKIYPHVHWAPTTGDAGTVCWKLEYEWANVKSDNSSDYTFGAPSTIDGTDTTNSTAWEHFATELDEINIDFNLSSMLVCRLYRDTSEDTYGADAALLEFDIHVLLDSIGSKERYNK